MVNKSYQKRCKKCSSVAIKKDGFKRGKQRWKCKECGHLFQNKTRTVKKKIKNIWNEYCFGKQTYGELGEKYGRDLCKIIKYKLPKNAKRSKIREIFYFFFNKLCHHLQTNKHF